MRAEDTDPHPNPPILNPVMRHLLEVSLQQSQEMARGLHMDTQELLSLKQTAPAAAISLPDPAQDAQCMLTKLTAEDDIEAFLGPIENIASRDG